MPPCLVIGRRLSVPRKSGLKFRNRRAAYSVEFSVQLRCRLKAPPNEKHKRRKRYWRKDPEIANGRREHRGRSEVDASQDDRADGD